MMTPELAALLEDVDTLAGTDRVRRLADYRAKYAGTMYDDKEFTASGERRRSPGVYGSAYGSPDWSERAVEHVYPLRMLATRELSKRAMGGNFWCEVAVPDDREAQDWLRSVQEMTCAPDVFLHARNEAGGMGTSVVSFAWDQGLPYLETHPVEEVWPLRWRSQRSRRLAAVVRIYQGDNPLAKKPEDRPLMARYWDEVDEATYIRQKDDQGEWVWTLTSTVRHGYGFCPVYWFANGPLTTCTDGTPDAPEADGEADDCNQLLAAASITTKRNADDTLIVHEDPEKVTGRIRKGGENAIVARGGASYLTQTGDSARVCVEMSKERESHVFRMFSVVFPDQDALTSALTAPGLQRLYEPMTAETGRIQRASGRGLIIPVLQGLLDSARMHLARGERLAIPPRIDVDKTTGITTVAELTPGRSNNIELTWPNPFAPTPQDSQMVATGVVACKAGGVMSTKTAIKQLAAHAYDIADVAAEIEAVKKEAAEAQAQATAMVHEQAAAKAAAVPPAE